jgi:hypothetical protein
LCSSNKLTSLKGSPVNISDNFYCSNNLLTSLEHGPKTISGDFYFANNNFPEYVQKKINKFKGT